MLILMIQFESRTSINKLRSVCFIAPPEYHMKAKKVVKFTGIIESLNLIFLLQANPYLE